MTPQPVVDEHVRAACHRLADLTAPTIGLSAEEAATGLLVALATVMGEVWRQYDDKEEAERIIHEVMQVVTRELTNAQAQPREG